MFVCRSSLHAPTRTQREDVDRILIIMTLIIMFELSNNLFMHNLDPLGEITELIVTNVQVLQFIVNYII